MDVHVVQGEGDVLRVFVPHYHNGKCRWVVVSDSYAKTSQHFRPANVFVESLIRGLYGDIFDFKIKVRVYEKIAKQ